MAGRAESHFSLPAHGLFARHRRSPAERIDPAQVDAATRWALDGVVLRGRFPLPDRLVNDRIEPVRDFNFSDLPAIGWWSESLIWRFIRQIQRVFCFFALFAQTSPAQQALPG